MVDYNQKDIEKPPAHEEGCTLKGRVSSASWCGGFFEDFYKHGDEFGVELGACAS